MSTKKTDHAFATTPSADGTAEEVVTLGTTIIDGISGSTEIPKAPGVAAALGLFATENGNLEANNKKKAQLLIQLQQIEADEITLRRRWGLRRLGVLHEVNIHCDGSKEKVQAFNLEVIDRKKPPQATVPEKVHGMMPRKKAAGVAWSPVEGAHGYMVQHATDPSDPATHAPPAMCRKTRFWVTGLVPGSTIAFRVLALDPSLPNGQTDYCAWVTLLAGV